MRGEYYVINLSTACTPNVLNRYIWHTIKSTSEFFREVFNGDDFKKQHEANRLAGTCYMVKLKKIQ
jgi:hypothetical protein